MVWQTPYQRDLAVQSLVSAQPVLCFSDSGRENRELCRTRVMHSNYEITQVGHPRRNDELNSLSTTAENTSRFRCLSPSPQILGRGRPDKHLKSF